MAPAPECVIVAMCRQPDGRKRDRRATAVGGPASTAGIQVIRSSDREQFDWHAVERDRRGASIFSSNNLITGNGTGLSSVGGGNLLTYKNNSVDGNLAAGAFTGQITPE